MLAAVMYPKAGLKVVWFCKLRVVEGIIELRPKLHGLWSVLR